MVDSRRTWYSTDAQMSRKKSPPLTTYSDTQILKSPLKKLPQMPWFMLWFQIALIDLEPEHDVDVSRLARSTCICARASWAFL